MVLKVETIANVGWPDIVLVPPWGNPPGSRIGVAHVIWIEFKREGETLSPIQSHVQSLLAKRNQRVYTVYTVKQFQHILDTSV